MPIIQKGMSINCRNEEEARVFIEVATAEGHKFAGRGALNIIPMQHYLLRGGVALHVGYEADKTKREFPNDISMSETDWDGHGTLTLVEASDLFRNHLISRRAKHDSSTE